MLNEEQIRADVHRIANSIGVDTDEQLAAVLAQGHDLGRATTLGEARGRRRLVPIAAAVSVACLLAAGTALIGKLPDGGSGVDRVAPVVLAGTPDGTVPSIFGHTRESATSLLEDRGLQVRYGEQISCDPAGRPVATEPATGAPVEPGEAVTVLLSYQGPTTDCMADLREPWRFVDFATGRGPSPRFADNVHLFVDGVGTGTLSGVEAAGRDWGAHSALSILDRATEQVLREGDSYRTPELQVTTGTPPDTWCGVARPQGVGDRAALTLTIAFQEVAAPTGCPARLALYRTRGAIDTVVAWSDRARGSRLEPIPDVVGLSLTEARNRVTAAGYPARVEKLETCHPRRQVVEQAPTQLAVEQDREDDPGWYGPVTLVVEVPHTTRDCAALDAAASAFLHFARGGPPPAWAPEVQQLLGYAPWATVDAARADDPAEWSFCSGAPPEDCGVSPLVVARSAEDVVVGEFSDVTRWPSGQTCELIDRGGLPSGLPPERQVVLYPAELTSCDDEWAVWLWIDETGRITALNLLVPAAASADDS